MGNHFRLNYLKSTQLERTDAEVTYLYPPAEKMKSPPSSLQDPNISESFTYEAILKQVKVDLKNHDSKVRMLAVRYYLEKFYPSISMALLQEILSDQDGDIRAEALRSLIKFRSPIVTPLLKKYLKDSDPKVRMTALRGMFRYQEKVDLNILLQFLSDESPWVRRKVATLLGWNHMEGALPILMEMSRDQDSMVRKAALFSMVTLYPEESENRLLEAMMDSDPNLCKWAKMTLEKIVVRPVRGKADLNRN